MLNCLFIYKTYLSYLLHLSVFIGVVTLDKMATRRKSKDYEAASSCAKPKNMVTENMQSKLISFVCLLSNNAMEIFHLILCFVF